MAEARRLNPGAGHPCRPHFFCHEDSPTAVGLSVLDLRGNCQALPFDAPLPDPLPVETIFLHPPITKDLKPLIVALELLTAVS
jgi:hypothetical protein